MIKKRIRIVEEGDIIKIIANVKAKGDKETDKLLKDIRIQASNHYEEDDKTEKPYGDRNILSKILFPEYTVKYIDTKKRIFLHTSQGKVRGRISLANRLHMRLEGFKDFASGFYDTLRDFPY